MIRKLHRHLIQAALAKLDLQGVFLTPAEARTLNTVIAKLWFEKTTQPESRLQANEMETVSKLQRRCFELYRRDQ